jgi:thioesterase domain-containing protein
MIYVNLGLTVPQNWRNAYMLHLTHFAERHYDPSFYAGKITLFVGKGLDGEPLLGWKGLAAEIDRCEIGGYHRIRRNMMDEPHVQLLAAELKKRTQGVKSQSNLAPATSN